MRKILALLFSLYACAAQAQIIGALPFTLQNGTIADANQVMSDLNTIVAGVNANAANAGVNTNINALNNLTTPLVYTSGGTSNYIGGTSGGSANAQVIASPIPSGFTLVTGKSVTFVAGFTNNGPTTLNVASTGATNVFKPGATGPVALSSGELTAGNLVTASFDGTQFQITGVSPQSLVPTCTMIDVTGVVIPSGFLLADGSLVSRVSFATLFGCLTFSGQAATTTSGSASVVVANSAIYQIGWSVGGTNVTCNSTILTIPDGTHITISNNAGASGATTLTIGPYPQGDCSTTFNLPDLRGRMTAMFDATGQAITANTCTNPGTVGSKCGAQNTTLVTGNLPPYTPSGAVNISNGSVQPAGGASGSSGTGGASSFWLNTTATVTGAFVGTAQGGTSTAFTNLSPVGLVYKAVKF